MTDFYLDGIDDDLEPYPLRSAPRGLLAAMGVEIVLALGCFLAGTRPANWLGYLLGAWAAAITAVAHREVDRRRSREPDYVPAPWVGRLVAAALLAGLLVAAAHVLFLAQETHFE